MSASALISIIFLCCVKTYKFYDVSFSNKYKFNFYDAENLVNHFYKHKDDVGCRDVESYLKKANSVILDKKSIHKTIANGDTVYYNKKPRIMSSLQGQAISAVTIRLRITII